MEIDFNYIRAEPLAGDDHSQSQSPQFSARYGNIYTVRQLLQLFERAYGIFEPIDQVWKLSSGKVADPFRPTIVDGGFETDGVLFADRRKHFLAVQEVFETASVFIFTLGLTEAWVSTRDGAVFPLAPGVLEMQADPAHYAFKNFTLAEMQSDFEKFLGALGKVNPACRIILTVSPVPLVATYENSHVLTSTTYSKSALRVLAEWARQTYSHVEYFPSYEVITGPHARSAYYGEDLREVRSEGVSHVMRIFRKHYLGSEVPSAPVASQQVSEAEPLFDMKSLNESTQRVICDEEQIERRI